MDKLKLKEIYLTECVKNKLSYKQVREKYNIPRGTWDYYIRQKYNFKADRRKHKAEDCFFDNIDSEIKAYLLGFLYADGYLASDGRMGIRLQRDDEEIIHLIKTYICPQSNIEYSNNQNIKRKPQVSIRWKSHKMYSRLMSLGFAVDKTHTPSNLFTKIPDNMKLHFLRGFTDGDGHISAYNLTNGSKRKISICWCNGTKEILLDIQQFISKWSKSKLYFNNTYYTLRCDYSKEVPYLVRELYQNAHFYLKRKQKTATDLINYQFGNTELT